MSSPDLEVLRGKRLGKWERGLLITCSLPTSTIARRIRVEGASRSTQASAVRAARNLESVGLLSVFSMREATKAFDKKCAEPIYRDGEFFRREEPSRIQWVNCLVGWLTPFGAGIQVEYMLELREQRAIRWTAPRLERAYDIGASEYTVNPDVQAASREETATMLAQEPEISSDLFAIAPPGGNQNLPRWTSSTRCAAGELGASGSRKLWDRAVEIFASPETDRQITDRCPARRGYSGRRTAKPGQIRHAHRELP